MPDLRAGLLRDLAQLGVVGLGHVEEALAEGLLVGADQGVHAHEVDVVAMIISSPGL